MTNPDFTMSPETRAGLAARMAARDFGENATVVCNADARAHLHALRIGRLGDGLAGRIGVQVHDETRVQSVYIAAPEARRLAADLLNTADELDGTTPLVFFPPGPDGVHPIEGE